MWASFNLLRAWTEKKDRGRKNSLLFSCPTGWAGDISFQPLWSMDWNLHHQWPWFSGLGLRLNYTTSFPGSPTCRWWTMELSLHNHVNQFLIKKPPIYIHIYIFSSFLMIAKALTDLFEENFSNSKGQVLNDWLCRFMVNIHLISGMRTLGTNLVFRLQ